MILETMDRAERALHTYILNSPTTDRYTLDRLRTLLNCVDNPQDRFRAVHIAGTSGKTSTAYFLRGLLEAGGAHTGMTVSPHIDTIRERVQLAGVPIAEAPFLDHLSRLLSVVEMTELRPTYFEILIALAFLVFSEDQVDYAVVETGLGGLLDGTNTLTRSDKICVITDIGLDHTEILGETIAEIALQKGGIIHPGNDVVMQPQPGAAVGVVEQTATERGARSFAVITESGTEDALPGADLPAFQRRNWRLAVAVYQMLANSDRRLAPLDRLHGVNPLRLQPPGRLEKHRLGSHLLILDGAHNPQKLRALGDSLKEDNLGRVTVVANLVNAPEHKLDDSLRELRQLGDTLIVPDFSVVQDVNKTSYPATMTATHARACGFRTAVTTPGVADALRYARSLKGDTILVTGSLYLVAQVRDLLRA